MHVCLYLYVYENGNAVSFDSNPTVDIVDVNGNYVLPYTGLSTCLVTKGVYKVDINGLTSSSIPCLYYDIWKGLSVNGVPIDDAENEFVLLKKNGNYKIGTLTNSPNIYGFSFNGIKQNEKIIKGEKRKVVVKFRSINVSKTELFSDVFFRMFIKEGRTNVIIHDWTQLDVTNENSFTLNTENYIPREYFIELKGKTHTEEIFYKNYINFEIISEK